MQVSENVHKIINIANTVAAGTGTSAMPIHLLYGCTAITNCLASKYLASIGITTDTMSGVRMVHKPDMSIPSIIMEADKVSGEFGQNTVVSEAMLFVLCTECLQTVEVLEKFGRGNCIKLAKKILEGAGIDPKNLADPGHKQKDGEGVFTPFGFQRNAAPEGTAGAVSKVFRPQITQVTTNAKFLNKQIIFKICVNQWNQWTNDTVSGTFFSKLPNFFPSLYLSFSLSPSRLPQSRKRQYQA